MGTPEIGLLQANLSELYSILSNKKQLSDLQIASRNKICHHRSWSVFGDILFGERSSLEKINEVVTYTFQTLFDHCVVQQAYDAHHRRVSNWIHLLGKSAPKPLSDELKAVQKRRYYAYTLANFGKKRGVDVPESIQKYVDSFKLISQENVLKASEVDRTRQILTACNHATRPFWQKILKPLSKQFVKPIKSMIKNDSLLQNAAFLQTLSRVQCVIDLESILEKDIPLVEIAKLSQPECLSKVEKQRIQKWIECLNAKKQVIPLENFRLVLTEIVRIVNIEGQYRTSLDQLVWNLNELKCELFSEEEPEHMEWREKLKPDSEIECNGKKFILGEEIGQGKVVDDQFRIFTLKQQKDWVVQIARNRFQLKIKNAQKEKEQEGIQSVECIKNIGNDEESVSGLDEKGKCVILEKLALPLDDYKWSPTKDKLALQDEEIALVIANHIYCMHQRNLTPEDLNVEPLMFDSRGVLKSLHLLQKGPFNYNILEQFCEAVAKGCLGVLNFIVHTSKLFNHPIAQFYQKAVLHVLKTGKTNLLILKQPKQYQHVQYKERVEQLCEQAKKMRRVCYKAVRDHLRRKGLHKWEKDEQLEQEVYARLIQYYEASPTPGILSDSLKDRVIQSFLNGKEEAVITPEMHQYYQAGFDRMMEYNQAALATKLEIEAE